MLKEFKKFALKGNMIDLAVGVVIGGAFNGLISSLVSYIIMPLLGLFTGKLDFSNWFIALDGERYRTLAEAEVEGVALVKYGSFFSEFLNFLIMAFVVFVVVKQLNRLHKEEVKPVTTKKCPYCLSEIPKDATKCAFCASDLGE